MLYKYFQLKSESVAISFMLFLYPIKKGLSFFFYYELIFIINNSSYNSKFTIYSMTFYISNNPYQIKKKKISNLLHVLIQTKIYFPNVRAIFSYASINILLKNISNIYKKILPFKLQYNFIHRYHNIYNLRVVKNT